VLQPYEFVIQPDDRSWSISFMKQDHIWIFNFIYFALGPRVQHIGDILIVLVSRKQVGDKIGCGFVRATLFEGAEFSPPRSEALYVH
jgi:hypothetical protein